MKDSPGEPGGMAQFLERRTKDTALMQDRAVQALVGALQERVGGEIFAVLIYGSYLRGVRDTLLDFYVVVEDYRSALGPIAGAAAFLMPPNVYYLSLVEEGRELRAKYAVVSRSQLQRQAGAVHPYFWARLAQPCQVVYVKDAAARRRLSLVLAACVRTFIKRVAPALQGWVGAESFFDTGFARTYRAELRAESPAKVQSIFRHDVDYYSNLLKLAADEGLLQRRERDEDQPIYAPTNFTGSTRNACYWGGTIGLGKLLSVLRLVKAAATFNDPIDYLLWKIERHSGVTVEASARQRRYPLIFAWPLAWRLYRLGAFR